MFKTILVHVDGSPRQDSRLRAAARLADEHGARPVLVVPPGYGGAPLDGTVVAGWDGRLPALRALGAALPLPRRASVLRLVLVNPEPGAGPHGDEPGADMALYLARHGVTVEVHVERTRASVGAALATLARDGGAGLMVCGAYGHGRLHEWMLGGATRELLARAPLPLLIAH